MLVLLLLNDSGFIVADIIDFSVAVVIDVGPGATATAVVLRNSSVVVAIDNGSVVVVIIIAAVLVQ